MTLWIFPVELKSNAASAAIGAIQIRKNIGSAKFMRPTAAKASATVAAMISRLCISGLFRYLTAAPKSPPNRIMSPTGRIRNPAACSAVHSPLCTCITGAANVAITPMMNTAAP